MRSVDAYVFPSRYEAMSLSLLEAMAAGLPVVTARTAGGAEIITRECGIVLEDPDDPAALAQAIGSLAASRDTCRTMGEAARELMTRFGWAHMGAQYVALYRRIGQPTQPSAFERAEQSRRSKRDVPIFPADQIVANRHALVPRARGRPRPDVLLARRRAAGRGRRVRAVAGSPKVADDTDGAIQGFGPASESLARRMPRARVARGDPQRAAGRDLVALRAVHVPGPRRHARDSAGVAFPGAVGRRKSRAPHRSASARSAISNRRSIRVRRG